MTDLLTLTSDLVDIASVSRDEAAMADRVMAVLAGNDLFVTERIGDNVIARTELGRSQRLVLAGHLDTVVPNGNERAKVEGDICMGLGACDMKGALAVFLDIAAQLRSPSVDLTLCFYVCEEIGYEHNGLAELFRTHADLLSGDAAILGEPTAAKVEAGCQGTMRVKVETGGVRAHSARPFMGVNAIQRLGPVVNRIAAYQPREVVIDGCHFLEQLQVVAIEGGVARNVVPDHAALWVNHRFAPDRSAAEAENWLFGYLADLLDEAMGDRFSVEEASEGAAPGLDTPLLRALGVASGMVPSAKVGWTDVATFSRHGIAAANFGPGDPLFAHHPDEFVTRSDLDRVRQVLWSLLHD